MGADTDPPVAAMTPEKQRYWKMLGMRQKRRAARIARHLQALAAAHQRAEELDQLAGCTTHASIYPDCFDD